VIAVWESQPNEPTSPTERAVLARAYAELGNDKAAPLIKQLRAFSPTEADALSALLFARQEQPAASAAAMISALKRMHQDPWPNFVEFLFPLVMQAAVRAANQNDLKTVGLLHEQLARPFALYRLEDQRTMTLWRVAVLLGPEAWAEATLGFEGGVPWTREFLAGRVAAYQGANDPYHLLDQARRDLELYISQESSSLLLRQ
jgi:hypothetical protein